MLFQEKFLRTIKNISSPNQYLSQNLDFAQIKAKFRSQELRCEKII